MRIILIFFIYLYKAINPILFGLAEVIGLRTQCKFPISCSDFAIDELRNSKNLFGSCKSIAGRLLSCGPWNSFVFFFLRHKSQR
ncbi:MAG: hypothetical protein COV44_11405 [Deltaproteobacteria bacterium CG11_big_fil_rev_8_21_14_0_20_45_16]|nr:MAG: hypothetical protein COV44_11405 [Deltaproteobacteria bacterium CG11_big_fil_rev_8_21_14_0_20_45_16]